MLVTSKGRYALRLMIYIATASMFEHADWGVTSAEAGSRDRCADAPASSADGAPRAARPRPAAKIALREVAEREHISLKYLEQLVRPLMAAGLLTSVRGKGGGYVLARPATAIRAGDILRAAEGERSAIACDGLEGTCGRSELCTTVQFWVGLEDAIDAYVDSVTLADLVQVPHLSISREPHAGMGDDASAGALEDGA